MKNILTLVLILASFAMFAQEKFTLSGTISEAQSGETMIGVNVLIPALQTGVVTNQYGFYSITLPKGTHQVIYTSLGFESYTQTIELNAAVNNSISLFETTEMLDVVILETDVEKTNIKTPQMSVTTLKANTIKRIPVVLGEADVLKAITLLPGVTNAGEGASGFNVRGGAADQNLVLLDEATLYNSSHLFGFFSVFNPDAIKDLTLYKGGIPARYGGRIASVLDIYQKDGNKRAFGATGGIGLLASRLLLEGPIIKDKGSFLIGGRSTYAHLFIPLVDPGNENVAYFYDLNTKLSYDIDDQNKLFLSGYFGRDTFNLGEVFGNTFGNTTLNLRWNHLFNDTLFSNLSLIYSDYYYGLELKFAEFQFDSGIRNFNLKYDFTSYVSDAVKLQFGFNSIYYKFNPGEVFPTTDNSGRNYRKLTDKYAFENAGYIHGNIKVSEKLIQNINSYSDREIAFEVMHPFVGNEISKNKLREIIADTLIFDFPILPINDKIATLELFHGPTLAFKDVGARFMARCLKYANEIKLNKSLTILVATSGDTGGAVADGFYKVEGINVVILYPKGKVSAIQEKQLTTLGENITALEVDGTFDDCQDMVKSAFIDSDLINEIE